MMRFLCVAYCVVAAALNTWIATLDDNPVWWLNAGAACALTAMAIYVATTD